MIQRLINKSIYKLITAIVICPTKRIVNLFALQMLYKCFTFFLYYFIIVNHFALHLLYICFTNALQKLKYMKQLKNFRLSEIAVLNLQKSAKENSRTVASQLDYLLCNLYKQKTEETGIKRQGIEQIYKSPEATPVKTTTAQTPKKGSLADFLSSSSPR